MIHFQNEWLDGFPLKKKQSGKRPTARRALKPQHLWNKLRHEAKGLDGGIKNSKDFKGYRKLWTLLKAPAPTWTTLNPRKAAGAGIRRWPFPCFAFCDTATIRWKLYSPRSITPGIQTAQGVSAALCSARCMVWSGFPQNGSKCLSIGMN